jgi:hypothetical protein
MTISQGDITGTHIVSASRPTPELRPYDPIHNITHKTQSTIQDTAVNPQLTYDFCLHLPDAEIGVSPRAGTERRIQHH